jgi:hypothetical protein
MAGLMCMQGPVTLRGHWRVGFATRELLPRQSERRRLRRAMASNFYAGVLKGWTLPVSGTSRPSSSATLARRCVERTLTYAPRLDPARSLAGSPRNGRSLRRARGAARSPADRGLQQGSRVPPAGDNSAPLAMNFLLETSAPFHSNPANPQLPSGNPRRFPGVREIARRVPRPQQLRFGPASNAQHLATTGHLPEETDFTRYFLLPSAIFLQRQ